MSDAPWNDPSWLEKGDNAWQRRLRRHQSWWREAELKRRAGLSARRDRPVASMLPDDAPLAENLFTEDARGAYVTTQQRRRASGERGILEPDRMSRNLLSSQPLCFNLFGFLSSEPQSVLPWVRTLAPLAQEVLEVSLEVSPVEEPIGGSAFDAFVTYRFSGRKRGFLGIECKYAEDLKKSQTSPARQEYATATETGRWRADAAGTLNVTGLRQFWYNTLLAQQALKDFQQGHSVVVALAGDHKARQAVADVAQELKSPGFLRFASIEDIVFSVSGHEEWKAMFTRRYLDLTPSA